MKQLTVALACAACLAACTPEATENSGEAVDAQPPSADTMRPDANDPAGGEGAMPADWTFRPDRMDHPHAVGADTTADVFFANMTPGWHVTTGPAGIFSHSGSTASGSYAASSDIHLFDPGDRREAFGLFFGGTGLDGDNQAYTYFLIRQGGQFLVKERTGTDTRTLLDWTSNDAIASFDAASGSSVMNSLMIDVGADTVSFSVNDVRVGWLPTDSVRTGGLVGFRVNHGLNLHISSLEVAQR